MTDTIEIKLYSGANALVDSADSDLANIRWHIGTAGYAQRKIPKGRKQTTQYMQRVILSRLLGRDLTTKEIVDHINGNRLDNRRENLRLCASAGNTQHRKIPSNNTSGFKGVHKDGNRFVAGITAHKKFYHLGSFGTPEEAARAYDAKAIEVHGEFARTNFDLKSRES